MSGNTFEPGTTRTRKALFGGGVATAIVAIFFGVAHFKSYSLHEVQTTPVATPAAGQVFSYFKADGNLYKKTSDDVEAQVGGGTTTGQFISRTILTDASGTFTASANTTIIVVRMLGGGGGGGGIATTGPTTAAASGGGGSAGYAEFTKVVSPSANFSYTTGAFGAGGAAGNNPGSAGGSTTFTHDVVVTANAGQGGQGSDAGTTVFLAAGGEVGVNSTNGDVNAAGSSGHPGIRLLATTFISGHGASSQLGGGGVNSGSPGTGYGAGGGGVHATNDTARSGGDGSQGVIVVDEYR